MKATSIPLAPGQRVTVRTKNNVYTLLILREQRVLIRGGTQFPRTAQAEVLGSISSKDEVLPGVLVEGQSVALACDGRCIVTSAVILVQRDKRTTIRRSIPEERRGIRVWRLTSTHPSPRQSRARSASQPRATL